MTAAERVHEREWFYRFELPDGTATDPYVPADVATIHDARLAMAMGAITTTFGADLGRLTALDMACHQGWFATKVAQAGVGEVLGIDVRAGHIDDARLMGEALGLPGIRWEQHDIAELRGPMLGTFDVVLMLGLLYHVENPVGALRAARAHTRGLCLVETQIAPSLTGVTDWGSHRYTRRILGNFAIIDEGPEVADDIGEANITPISLFPDLGGLVHLMRAVGFDRVEVLAPDPVNEQLATGKRAMVAGWVD